MKKFLQHTLALFVILAVVLLSGSYLTFMWQPDKLARVEKAIEVEKMKRAELTALLEEQDVSRAEAQEATAKWNARYKIIPNTLVSSNVVGRFNGLTQSGFKNFDVSFEGETSQPNYSFYTHRIEGRGYFSNLYDFIWKVENSPQMYRVENLELSHIDLMTEVGEGEEKREHMQVMVSFTMNVHSYFNGAEGVSAPQVQSAALQGSQDMPMQSAPVRKLPRSVFPNEDPAINPFFPGILEELPPNTYDRIDVEEDVLVSIVGGEAVFKSEDEESGVFRSVGVGDAVYLGQIVDVDPYDERVVARLNKGGIIDEVVLELTPANERYKQALGDNELSPVGG